MKKFRNILAMLMVFVMLVAVMPMNVFAEENPAPGDETPTVTSIAIDTSSTYKTEYKVGDTLDVSGLKIKVTKSDNSEETVDVTSEMVTGFDSKAATESQTLTITYEGKKATYTVSIKAKEPEVKKFKLTAKVEGEGGKVSPESKEDIEENTEETVTITPNENYEIAEVKVNDVDKTKEVKNKELKLTMNEDKNVVVKFKKTVNEDEKKELEEARKAALAELDKLTYLTKEQKDAAIAKINATDDKKAINAVVEAAKKQNEENKPVEPKPETKEYTISKAYTNHGSFTVSESKAKAGETITVTATPNYGYAVKNVYYKKADGTRVNIKNYAYNDYYYYAYNDRYYDGYYGDYYRYYSDYENNYYHDYSSYDAYLKDRHYSFWNNGYRYWDDYDYKYYNRYYDRYNDRYYDGYYSDYYRYYDDYVDNYYRRYSSYEDYLYDKHYSHYRDYRYYDKYDYRYYNYTTTDTFEMPASNVTVYVEFTDWSYYGYYYDDYYYYRYHRDKKDKDKEEEKAKEEEKVVEEKTPQVFEASATINVGSKVFTKVNKNVTTTHQMDVAAYVKNGRVMLPLRYVAEALGLQVSWVPQTKTVIIWDLTQKVEIPIKSNKIIVNGVTYTSDVKPEIKNSRTMLPIANVARALGLIDGADIIWDPVMKQVKLTRRVLSK